MATPFSEIIINHAMQDIDDVRWEQELKEDPALFFRRKSVILVNSIPRFNKPPEIMEWLTFVEAGYDDYIYTADSAQTAPVVISTGKIGYETCSVGKQEEINNTPVYTPIECEYDAETGEVTIQTNLNAGAVIDIDFYTDGYFDNDLTPIQKRILGLCVAENWYSKFSNNWLNSQPKVKDASFEVGSEAGWIRAVNEKLRMINVALDGELRRYETTMTYRNVMPQPGHLRNI